MMNYIFNHYYQIKINVYEKNHLSLFKSDIKISPLRAHIMIAPFELLDLYVSHGEAGMYVHIIHLFFS